MTRLSGGARGVCFAPPLVEGRLVRRYQRFLAEVRTTGGQSVTAHCPNTGSMLGCQVPGSRVWLSPANKPGRRCPYTWELVEVASGALVGINTLRSNQLVLAALNRGLVAELAGHELVRPEAPSPDGAMRVDFLLRCPDGRPYYLEVKNVSAAVDARRALFPDAVSERASRHVRLLAELRRSGAGAGLLFCVQREDVDEVAPADLIDPVYGRELRGAAADGVDVLALRARVSPRRIQLDRRLPVVL